MSSTAPTPAISADRIVAGYERHTVLRDLSTTIEHGSITALVGPNGSGKSTLLKTLVRLLPPKEGAIYVDGAAIAKLPTATVARMLAVLPQGPTVPAGLTVLELVEQARFPHVGPLRMLGRQDHATIADALRLTNTTSFATRPVDALSGGERQRVWLALALAQATPALLLDEPTTFLDIGHQIEILDLIRTLNREHGKTIVMVLHDLNHAARYADRMIVLHSGTIVADGTPASVLSESLVEQVFGVHATILTDPVTHAPVCLPYGVIDPDLGSHV